MIYRFPCSQLKHLRPIKTFEALHLIKVYLLDSVHESLELLEGHNSVEDVNTLYKPRKKGDIISSLSLFNQ